MTRVSWSNPGDKRYELGVDRGVLYVDDQSAAWNGLVSIDESPSGGGIRSYYQDGQKYLHIADREEYSANLSAFYSPELFDKCDGTWSMAPGVSVTQQKRKQFGLTYRTKIGNDLNEELGHKIHLVYNALATPSSRNYQTKGDSPEAMTMSWSIQTRATSLPGMAPGSHIVIDTTEVGATALSAFEDILYGNEMDHARLPTPAEVADIFEVIFEVIDNLDGTYTISGTDVQVTKLNAILYSVTEDGVVMDNSTTYTISD